MADGMSCLERVRCEVGQTGNWVFEIERGSLFGGVTDRLGNPITGAGKVIRFFWDQIIY